MKRRKPEIAKEVERTMSLMDKTEKRKAPDDFYKKVNYRLHKRIEEERQKKNGLMKVLKPAAVTAITLLNLFSAYLLLSNQDYDETRYQELNTLNEELNLSSTDSDTNVVVTGLVCGQLADSPIKTAKPINPIQFVEDIANPIAIILNIMDPI